LNGTRHQSAHLGNFGEHKWGISVSAINDDDRGIWQTYNPLMSPNLTPPLASSAAFILLVNSGLSGVFAALVAVALDAPGPLVGAVAAACGLAFLGISLTLVLRQYQRMHRRYVALFPTPDSSIGRGDSHPAAPGVAARPTDASTWMPGGLEGRRDAPPAR
jgi:hypothetical protein